MPTAMHSVSVAAVIVDDTGRSLPSGGATTTAGNHLAESWRWTRTSPPACAERHEKRPAWTSSRWQTDRVYKNMKRGGRPRVPVQGKPAGQLSLNNEVSAFRWATPDEIAATVEEAFAVRIADVLADRQSPAVRQHDGRHLL